MGFKGTKNKQLIKVMLSSGMNITEQTKNEKKINENRDKILPYQMPFKI
jgi:hypothetical protein